MFKLNDCNKNNKLIKAYKILKKQGLLQLLLESIAHLNYLERKKFKKIFHTFGVNNLLIQLIDGKKFILNIEDLGLSYDLLFNKIKIREEFATNFLLSYLPNMLCNKNHETTFLDIGANIGYYSILLSDFFDKIIAIEPVKENIDILTSNIKINDLDNKVNVIKSAVGSTPGEGYIIQGEFKNLLTISEDPPRNDADKVKIYKIDDILHKFNVNDVSLVKMDVEGFEYEIIKSNMDFFEEYLPEVLFIEIHFDIISEHKTNYIFKKLNELGYSIKKAFVEVKDYDYKVYRKNIFLYIYKKKYGAIGEIASDVGIEDFISSKEYEKLIHKNPHAVEFVFEKKYNRCINKYYGANKEQVRNEF